MSLFLINKTTKFITRFSGPSIEGFFVSTLWVMLIFDGGGGRGEGGGSTHFPEATPILNSYIFS